MKGLPQPRKKEFKMRELYDFEPAQVGGGCSPTPCECPDTPRGRRRKGNNGFGNGGDDNREAPGNSDDTPGDKDGSAIR